MKKVLWVLVLILIVIQFIPALPDNAPVDAATDFISIHNPPAEVSNVLKKACYDCHSSNATWPWYAHVSPVSLWIGDHVKEGREHLNFSEWGTYDAENKDHMLEECAEEVEEGEMPLESYTNLHGDADLSPGQREALVDYFNSLR